ncbi:MAG: sensor domain-containing diguanylate cyclase [Eubacteriales bacterium]|nr:sensor domain-containing diguanylate cyclase [Eubacteriales bacterium]
MNSLMSVSITLDIVALLILFYVIIYIITGVGVNNQSGRYLIPLCVSLALQIAAGTTQRLTEGLASQPAFVAHKAAIAITYVLSYIASVCITMYLTVYASKRRRVNGRWILLSFTAAVIGAALLLITHVNGMIYYFDASRTLIRGALYPLSGIVTVLIFIINALLIFAYRKSFKKQEVKILTIFIAVPVAAELMRYFSYNRGLVNLFTVICFVFIFEQIRVKRLAALGTDDGKLLESLSGKGSYSEKTENLVKIISNTYGWVFHNIKECSYSDDSVKRLFIHDGVVNEVKYEEGWGKTIDNIIENEIYPDDREKYKKCFHPSELYKMTPGDHIVCSYRSNRSGEYLWYTTTARIIKNDDGSNSVIYLTRDADKESEAGERIKNVSEYDELTDLYNRKKLKQMITAEYINLKSCGVLFFDLNYLKITNDTFGHDAGDMLLCRTAESIRSITNKRIHAYRMGGDEFVVVVCDCGEGELSMLICLWKARLDQLNASGGIQCSVAVGSAWANENIAVEKLIKQADIEMYKDKAMIKANRE